MNKNVLQLAQVAAKFFFDLEPELTEVMLLSALAASSKAAQETLPVLVEAYNCHKTKVIQLFQHERPAHYRAA